jgi:hypothetical protein
MWREKLYNLHKTAFLTVALMMNMKERQRIDTLNSIVSAINPAVSMDFMGMCVTVCAEELYHSHCILRMKYLLPILIEIFI